MGSRNKISFRKFNSGISNFKIKVFNEEENSLKGALTDALMYNSLFGTSARKKWLKNKIGKMDWNQPTGDVIRKVLNDFSLQNIFIFFSDTEPPQRYASVAKVPNKGVIKNIKFTRKGNLFLYTEKCNYYNITKLYYTQYILEYSTKREPPEKNFLFKLRYQEDPKVILYITYDIETATLEHLNGRMIPVVLCAALDFSFFHMEGQIEIPDPEEFKRDFVSFFKRNIGTLFINWDEFNSHPYDFVFYNKAEDDDCCVKFHGFITRVREVLPHFLDIYLNFIGDKINFSVDIRQLGFNNANFDDIFMVENFIDSNAHSFYLEKCGKILCCNSSSYHHFGGLDKDIKVQFRLCDLRQFLTIGSLMKNCKSFGLEEKDTKGFFPFEWLDKASQDRFVMDYVYDKYDFPYQEYWDLMPEHIRKSYNFDYQYYVDNFFELAVPGKQRFSILERCTEYCLNDVKATALLRLRFEEFFTKFIIEPTLGVGQTRDIFATISLPTFSYKIWFEWLKINHPDIKIFRPTVDQYETFERAYFGGRCEKMYDGMYKNKSPEMPNVIKVNLPNLNLEDTQRVYSVKDFKYEGGSEDDLIFVDIDGHYNSAMAGHLPVGKISKLTSHQLKYLNNELKKKDWKILDYPPFFAFCKLIPPKDLCHIGILPTRVVPMSAFKKLGITECTEIENLMDYQSLKAKSILTWSNHSRIQLLSSIHIKLAWYVEVEEEGEELGVEDPVGLEREEVVVLERQVVVPQDQVLLDHY